MGEYVNVLLVWVTKRRLLVEGSLITEHQTCANDSET